MPDGFPTNSQYGEALTYCRCQLEQAVEQTVESHPIFDAVTLMSLSIYEFKMQEVNWYLDHSLTAVYKTKLCIVFSFCYVSFGQSYS